MALSIQSTGEDPSILGHIGSVEDVISARLSPEMTARRYQAQDVAMGFELATPKTINSLGEAVIVNGLCYATSTDSSSDDYNTTISGKEFTSGGVFLIPKGAKPTHRIHLKETISMIDFYNQLYGEIDHPLAFAGIFHFFDFHGIAVGKAPIDGRNIFTHKQEYYPNPEIHRKNTWGFVMGAVTNFKGHTKINEELKTVLYKNPMDASTTLVHHAHVLLLKKKIEHFEEIVPAIVDQTLHLFVEGTSVVSANVEIFLVGGVKDWLMKGKKT